jgi:hypothetical protein
MLNKNIKQKQKLSNIQIKEVYEDNFDAEMARLSLKLEKYKFIAMVYYIKLVIVFNLGHRISRLYISSKR